MQQFTQLKNILLAIFVFVVGISAAHAQGVCQINSNSNLNFGTYNAFALQPDDSVGMLQIGCMGVNKSVVSYTLSASAGTSNSYQQRQMVNGIHHINYNLYTDPARTRIWGSGFSGADTISGSFSKNIPASNVMYVYGRIPPGQTRIVAGEYNDTIMITAIF